VPDRESHRSEKKTGLSQNISLFMRIVHDTYRFAANVKILSRSVFEENSELFDENNGIFWPNTAFSHDCMDAQQ